MDTLSAVMDAHRACAADLLLARWFRLVEGPTSHDLPDPVATRIRMSSLASRPVN